MNAIEILDWIQVIAIFVWIPFFVSAILTRGETWAMIGMWSASLTSVAAMILKP